MIGTKLVLLSVALLASGSALAACPDPIPDSMSGPELKECVRNFQASIKQLTEQLANLKASAPVAIPQGAVVAFDRSDLDEDHCPDGWSTFLYARGRTLVGAGDPQKAPEKMAFDERGRKLEGYTLRQHGGEQIHQITLDELPPYSPIVLKQTGNPFDFNEGTAVPCLNGDQGCNRLNVITEGRSGLTTKPLSISGFGKVDNHNNAMPPYLAVFYCRKN